MDIAYLVEILIIPVVTMAFGGLFALFQDLGPKFISGMQHLASGILIGAVAWELVPGLVEITDPLEKGVVFIGFLSGVAVLMFLGRFEFRRVVHRCYGKKEDNEGNVESEVLSEKEKQTPSIPQFASIDKEFASTDKEKRTSKSDSDIPVVKWWHAREENDENKSQADIELATRKIAPGKTTDGDASKPYVAVEVDETTESNTKITDKPIPVPTGLVVGVVLDGTIDGLLIGVAFVSAESAGFLTSIALSCEMCLLGLSTAATLKTTKLPKWAVILTCFLFPLPIFVAGMIGASALSGLEGAPLIFVDSFGMGALLFLVAEELLVRAHEDEETDRWFVTLLFYVGFLICAALEYS